MGDQKRPRINKLVLRSRSYEFPKDIQVARRAARPLFIIFRAAYELRVIGSEWVALRRFRDEHQLANLHAAKSSHRRNDPERIPIAVSLRLVRPSVGRTRIGKTTGRNPISVRTWSTAEMTVRWRGIHTNEEPSPSRV